MQLYIDILYKIKLDKVQQLMLDCLYIEVLMLYETSEVLYKITIKSDILVIPLP